MGPDQLVFLVPIVAILGAFSTAICKMCIAHEERKIGLRSQVQANVSNSVREEIDALREELGRLRDTSTQYDISIQHTLEDMQQRLLRLESKRGAAPAARAQEKTQVTVGTRPS